MVTLNEEKYRNAILYFIAHTNKRLLGKKKLWKLLYYLDFGYYARYHTSVTGDEYRHWEMGPVPSNGVAVLNRMVMASALKVSERPTGLENPQMSFEALTECDRSVFSETEWQMLVTVAEEWKNRTGRDMSDATHDELPWRATEPSAVIDYDLALVEQSEENAAVVEMTRRQSLAYAERIEQLWDTDPVVRARIERGIAQMKAGQFVPLDVEELLSQRRENERPS